VASRGKGVRVKAREVREPKWKAGLTVKKERMGGCGCCGKSPETFPPTEGPSRRREPSSVAAELGLHGE